MAEKVETNFIILEVEREMIMDENQKQNIRKHVFRVFQCR